MMATKNYLLLIIALVFSACVQSKPEISFEKPEMQIPKPDSGKRSIKAST